MAHPDAVGPRSGGGRVNITTETYRTSEWKRAPGRPQDGPPPHRSPMQRPGDPAQLWPLRRDAHGEPYAVRDWDGCEAVVLGLSQVTSGPSPAKRQRGEQHTRSYMPDEHSLAAYHGLDGTERSKVYKCIRDLGPIACWQVEEVLRMKHQTASASIKKLRDDGLIQKFDEIPNEGGRMTWRYIIT